MNDSDFSVGDIVWHPNNGCWVKLLRYEPVRFGNKWVIVEGYFEGGEFICDSDPYNTYISRPLYWDITRYIPVFKSTRGNKPD